jgi:hypothetical protein
MQAGTILQNLLVQVCGSMHAIRRTALEAVVTSAVRSQRLTVTALGRGIEGLAREKHCIKRADRLLSNHHLQAEAVPIYAALAQRLVGSQVHPVIAVDWSDLDGRKQHQVLRASLVVAGRALTLYEEVHGRAKAEQSRAQQRFPSRLQAILPPGCRPVLITDAGFCTPWFREVEALGWLWVARIRQKHLLRWEPEGDWQSIRELHARARSVPRALGQVWLTRKSAHVCRLVRYRGKAKGRHCLTLQGQRARSRYSEKHARSGREPWLLATNLPASRSLAKQVVRLYRTRMQIEEAFRDLKSARFGLGFDQHRSRDAGRLAVLLLVAALALVLLWLLGSIARGRGIDRHYQANTVRTKPVLSIIYLGLRICERGAATFSAFELADAWQQITTINRDCWGYEH